MEIIAKLAEAWSGSEASWPVPEPVKESSLLSAEMEREEFVGENHVRAVIDCFENVFDAHGRGHTMYKMCVGWNGPDVEEGVKTEKISSKNQDQEEEETKEDGESTSPQQLLTFVVWRRYSEFRELWLNLCKANSGNHSVQIPPLPGRKFLGSSLDERFIRERMHGLQEWLVLLLDQFSLFKDRSEILLFLSRNFVHEKKPGKEQPILSHYRRQIGVEDFEPIRVIGRGSFGKVVVARKCNTSKLFAMKILKKKNIRKHKQIEHTKTERRLMARLEHPFIAELFYAFQTKSCLFLVLEFVPGGELFFHLGKLKQFPEEWTKLWSTEVILALKYLHDQDVVFRDLKPENILLDANGHVKLIDFGLCKEGVSEADKGASSFCGTPEYLAPEILLRRGYGKAVDYWSLGMVIYEMLVGLPPWYSQDRTKLFKRIQHAPLEFPAIGKVQLSENVKSLIRGLLEKEPKSRFDFSSLQNHPFFNGLDWEMVYNQKIPSQFIPQVEKEEDEVDTSNFDPAFTKLTISGDFLSWDCKR